MRKNHPARKRPPRRIDWYSWLSGLAVLATFVVIFRLFLWT